MSFWDQLFDFLKNQWPVILTLLYAYFNGKVIRAQQDAKTLQLQKTIEGNHAQILSKFAGMSDDAVVTEAASSGPQPDPNSQPSG